MVVSLTSGDPARISVPATVTIPAGQTSVPLPLSIIDDSLLNGPEAVAITATLSGYNNGVGTITIHDNETAVLTVSLPASAHENAGVLTAAGTITSSAAPANDITVQLLSSDTTGLTVPATVILHAGQTTANFNVTMVDDHVIQGDRPISVTAQMDNWTSGSATLTDLEDDAALTVTLPTSGWEGQTLANAGTVQLGGILPTSLTVSLASSDPTELSVPSTVTIPAGQRTATFNVTLLDNGLRTGPLSEQVTATAAGVTGGSATMLVNDSDVDHYGFTTISSPKLTATAFSVTVRAYDYLNNVITVYNGSAALERLGIRRCAVGQPDVGDIRLGRMDGERDRQRRGSRGDAASQQRRGIGGHEQRVRCEGPSSSCYDESRPKRRVHAARPVDLRRHLQRADYPVLPHDQRLGVVGRDRRHGYRRHGVDRQHDGAIHSERSRGRNAQRKHRGRRGDRSIRLPERGLFGQLFRGCRHGGVPRAAHFRGAGRLADLQRKHDRASLARAATPTVSRSTWTPVRRSRRWRIRPPVCSRLCRLRVREA